MHRRISFFWAIYLASWWFKNLELLTLQTHVQKIFQKQFACIGSCLIFLTKKPGDIDELSAPVLTDENILSQ